MTESLVELGTRARAGLDAWLKRFHHDDVQEIIDRLRLNGERLHELTYSLAAYDDPEKQQRRDLERTADRRLAELNATADELSDFLTGLGEP